MATDKIVRAIRMGTTDMPLDVAKVKELIRDYRGHCANTIQQEFSAGAVLDDTHEIRQWGAVKEWMEHTNNLRKLEKLAREAYKLGKLYEFYREDDKR